MSPTELFRINTENVVSDVVEGEVIIVDLKSGRYYSLDGAGAHIWTCLTSGMNLATITRSVAAAYDGSESEIAGVVEQLITELAGEQLLEAAAFDADQVPVSLPAVADAPSSEKKHFDAPILHKYTDMQELLLVDVVHDVDEEGWPILKKENPR
jgi:hypothetical protein